MVFKNTLDQQDLTDFVSYTSRQQVVKDLNKFYDSLPALNNEEIKATWNNEEQPMPENHFNGYVMVMANMRATREVLANRCTMSEDSGTDQFPDILKNYSKYSFWKNNYTKFR